MKILTKLKHWQIFLIIVGIMVLFLASPNLKINLGFLTPQALKAIFGVLGVIVIFLWVLSIGLLINQIPSNPYRFKKVLLILFTIVCVLGYSSLHLNPFLVEMFPSWNLISFLKVPLIFIGFIYVYYNVARSLKTFEVGQKVGFSGWILYAFLLFYVPIGVWIIQPKINKIAKDFDI